MAYLLQVVEPAVCWGEKVCLVDIFLVLARTQTGETWRDVRSDISAILIKNWTLSILYLGHL